MKLIAYQNHAAHIIKCVFKVIVFSFMLAWKYIFPGHYSISWVSHLKVEYSKAISITISSNQTKPTFSCKIFLLGTVGMNNVYLYGLLMHIKSLIRTVMIKCTLVYLLIRRRNTWLLYLIICSPYETKTIHVC